MPQAIVLRTLGASIPIGEDAPWPWGGDALGLLYFCGIKFAGYTAMAAVLRRRYPGATAASWRVGLARTVIGLAAGMGVMLLVAPLHLAAATPAFYVLLLPVRLAGWLLVLWWFYERRRWRWRRALGWAAVGVVWSCLLDVPALGSALLMPGAVRMC